MDKKKVVLGAAAVAALSTMAAEKAHAVAATMSAQAIIRQAVQAAFTPDLDFGFLSTTGTGAGTVVLDTTNTRTPGGTLQTAGGGSTNAVLEIKAAAGASINISLPVMPVVLSHGTSTDTMNIDRFTIEHGTTNGTQQIAGTGTAAGADVNMPAGTPTLDLTIGGRLNKPAGGTLTTGTYSNNAVVWNINYN